MMRPLKVAPGLSYWPERFSPAEQAALLAQILARVEKAPVVKIGE